jgi:LacI family transcriptional regulator
MPRIPNNAIRAATLADVGRLAGVSAMAASTVLNGARTSSRIAEDTRKRILKAAAQLSYRPNAAARALANRRMNTIGVAAVIGEDGALNHYFLEVFTGILGAATHFEQNTTMFTLRDWGRDPARLTGMCDGRIDGLILVAPTLTREAARLLPAHTPFVALHANCALPNVVNIESDEERGAYEVVRYLIAQGHRHILHITGDPGLIGAERRIRGFKKALAEVRIRFSDAEIEPGAYNREAGIKALRSWLKRHAGEPLPHAIFCANDAIATGCLEVLAEMGLRVPDDISVVGFDDTLAARTTVPQLASVRQPLRDMGRRAVEVLMARIEQQAGKAGEVSREPIIFPVEVVPRASVGPRPAVERLAPATR